MSEKTETKIENIRIENVFPSSTNPRKHFDENALQELADSISKHGLFQPILVRPIPYSEDKNGMQNYEIVYGERRYRASKIANMDFIKAEIRYIPDDEMLEIQVLENLQREDVSPLDEAKAFKSLMSKETVEWLASKINKTPKYVLNRVKLLDLAEELHKDLEENRLPLGHAYALTRLSKEEQLKIYQYAVNGEILKNFKIRIGYKFLSFDNAPFDINDEKLLPNAGGCQSCAKRTINNQLLFEDITSEDRCTDEICFKAKIQKYTENKIEFAKKTFGDNIKTGEKDQWSSHGIKITGEKETIYFKESESETHTIPVVIVKSDNNCDSKIGQVVWVEDFSKKEEKKQETLDLESRQAKKFDEVLVPRLKQLILESVSLPFATAKISKTYILEKLTSEVSLRYLLVVAHFLKIKELESLSYFEIKKTTDATTIEEDLAMCFEIASEIIKRFPIELPITILAIDDLITDDFDEDESVEEWELTINKIYSALKLPTSEIPVEDIETEAVDLTEELENLLEGEIGEGSSVITSTLDIPTFEKITRKRFSLNNSYFKNRTPQMPSNPVEVMYYFNQHGELPFDMGSNTENWLYECFVEYQKRAGVYHSQFFTPPATANQMCVLAHMYFDKEKIVLDACCGFGALSKPLIEDGFNVMGFDFSKEMIELYDNQFADKTVQSCEQINFMEGEFEKKYFNIISNPPYEGPALTKFLECVHENLIDGGTAILLIPRGFVDKDKPKALVSILEKFNITHREDMQEDFARTGIKAEIVVLEKA